MLGASIAFEDYEREFHSLAEDIYQTAPITPGIEDLAEYLLDNAFRIGIVSASPLHWITTTTQRLSFENDIEVVISLNDRPDLEHKPSPAGYSEAIKLLGAEVNTTFILEDSNHGISSAKASGAFTIGLTANLVEGVKLTGADVLVASPGDVIEIINNTHLV